MRYRVVVMHQNVGCQMVVEADFYAIDPCGSLTFEGERNGRITALRSFAAGMWCSVEIAT